MSQTVELLMRVLEEYGEEEEMGLLANVERMPDKTMRLYYTEPDTHYCIVTSRGRLMNDIYEYLFKNHHIKKHQFK